MSIDNIKKIVIKNLNKKSFPDCIETFALICPVFYDSYIEGIW